MPLEAAFRPFFKNFDNCQPEVASDAIPGPAIRQLGVDAQAKFGDSRLNSSRDMRLPHFVTDERRPTGPVVIKCK